MNFNIVSPPPPCCVPSKQRAADLDLSRRLSSGRQRVASGSTENMVRLDGGRFLMGTESAEGFPQDGEGPIREVTLDPFYMDVRPVSNDDFREFVNATGYRTESERFGWSFVFHTHIAAEKVEDRVAGVEWWCKVSGADWAHPEGPDSSIDSRGDFPVIHVSWNDAAEYAKWAGKRLPTEAEWEYAMRAGSTETRFPWGDSPKRPEGQFGLNFWQGSDHRQPSNEDGHVYLSPVRAFPPNAWGFFDPVGNVWQWVADVYAPDAYARRAAGVHNPVQTGAGGERVSRGGSWWCSAKTCHGYGLFYRGKAKPEAPFNNVGFRCARDIEPHG
jgi:sulfatase modifying factor 1